MIDKIALQASIYRSCEEFAKEGKLLDRLSVLSTGMREQEEETKLLQEDLVHREAIAAGARVCLNTECSRIEVGMKFEICGYVKCYMLQLLHTAQHPLYFHMVYGAWCMCTCARVFVRGGGGGVNCRKKKIGCELHARIAPG